MYLRSLICIVLAGSLGACSTLPSSGPTGSQIRKDAAAAAAAGTAGNPGMEIVEVSNAGALPAPASRPRMTLADRTPPPTDMVGPGDVLSISIYEAGVTLFGSGTAATGAGSPSFDPTVKVQTLPPSRVDDNGDIVIPYAGKLHVLGRTVGEIQAQIRAALRGYSQNPQVLVTLRDVINNSVIIGGEVAKPGRLVLQTNRETLSDVVALAGGYRGNARDLTLRVARGQQVLDLRLSDLASDPALDVRAYPGDRVSLILDPHSFSVLGASGRSEQVPFSRSQMSLAEAVATSGGTNPSLGDPAAIFVFRYVTDAQGVAKPVIYHLNMMKAGAYFLSQNFAMRDKDVLYFGNASANQPTKVIQLVSQLFSPILTVTSAVQTVQNSN